MSELLAWLLVLPPSAMLAWFTAEVAFGLRPLRVDESGEQANCTIVIPAHDEEAGIAATLGDLTQRVPADRILVVADNCTDRTAAIARSAGVRVVERSDPLRRGKGHALAFAREALREAPPSAIMVLDADCRIVRGEPVRLAARAIRNATAVQAENLQLAPGGSGPLARIGAFAFLVMNVIRARGLARIGGGAFLQGTGWVVPWSLFERLALASDDPVEDIDLTLQLARLGAAALPDPRCRVTSLSPGDAAHLLQRRRWEQGSIRAVRRGGALFAVGLTRGSRLQASVGAHYAVPPIAFLASGSLAVFAIVGALFLVGWVSLLPVAALLVALVMAFAATIAAWLAEGRETIDLATLLRVPVYISAKLPIYLGLARGSGREWNRTERPPSTD